MKVGGNTHTRRDLMCVYLYIFKYIYTWHFLYFAPNQMLFNFCHARD